MRFDMLDGFYRETLEMRRVTKLEKRIASDALRAAPLICIDACPNCVPFALVESTASCSNALGQASSFPTGRGPQLHDPRR
jgi:hypothetical protein